MSDLRFPFGDNWRRFLAIVDQARIDEAVKSLQQFLGVTSLAGRRFLDVGSGSGLFSLAARRLDAAVVSFDFDPQSVACTHEMRDRFRPDDAAWRVLQGSVLDDTFLRALGQFDVVYAWGVLHHTGDLWRALRMVSGSTAPGGLLFVAVYNDCGRFSRRWLERKRRYNMLPRALRLPYVVWAWTPSELRSFAKLVGTGRLRQYINSWRHYGRGRGMSRWRDIVDWVGGYPYEFAPADRLVEFVTAEGFSAVTVVPSDGPGNHQIVFRRRA